MPSDQNGGPTPDAEGFTEVRSKKQVRKSARLNRQGVQHASLPMQPPTACTPKAPSPPRTAQATAHPAHAASPDAAPERSTPHVHAPINPNPTSHTNATSAGLPPHTHAAAAAGSPELPHGLTAPAPTQAAPQAAAPVAAPEHPAPPTPTHTTPISSAAAGSPPHPNAAAPEPPHSPSAPVGSPGQTLSAPPRTLAAAAADSSEPPHSPMAPTGSAATSAQRTSQAAATRTEAPERPAHPQQAPPSRPAHPPLSRLHKPSSRAPTFITSPRHPAHGQIRPPSTFSLSPEAAASYCQQLCPPHTTPVQPPSSSPTPATSTVTFSLTARAAVMGDTYSTQSGDTLRASFWAGFRHHAIVSGLAPELVAAAHVGVEFRHFGKADVRAGKWGMYFLHVRLPTPHAAALEASLKQPGAPGGIEMASPDGGACVLAIMHDSPQPASFSALSLLHFPVPAAHPQLLCGLLNQQPEATVFWAGRVEAHPLGGLCLRHVCGSSPLGAYSGDGAPHSSNPNIPSPPSPFICPATTHSSSSWLRSGPWACPSHSGPSPRPRGAA